MSIHTKTCPITPAIAGARGRMSKCGMSVHWGTAEHWNTELQSTAWFTSVSNGHLRVMRKRREGWRKFWRVMDKDVILAVGMLSQVCSSSNCALYNVQHIEHQLDLDKSVWKSQKEQSLDCFYLWCYFHDLAKCSSCS